MPIIQGKILICPKCKRKLADQNNIEQQWCSHCQKFVIPIPIDNNAWKLLQKKIDERKT